MADERRRVVMFEKRKRKAAIKRLYSPEGKAELESIAKAKDGEMVALTKIRPGDLRYLPLSGYIKKAYSAFE